MSRNRTALKRILAEEGLIKTGSDVWRQIERKLDAEVRRLSSKREFDSSLGSMDAEWLKGEIQAGETEALTEIVSQAFENMHDEMGALLAEAYEDPNFDRNYQKIMEGAAKKLGQAWKRYL
jgi:hypothetical protein